MDSCQSAFSGEGGITSDQIVFLGLSDMSATAPQSTFLNAVVRSGETSFYDEQLTLLMQEAEKYFPVQFRDVSSKLLPWKRVQLFVTFNSHLCEDGLFL